MLLCDEIVGRGKLGDVSLPTGIKRLRVITFDMSIRRAGRAFPNRNIEIAIFYVTFFSPARENTVKYIDSVRLSARFKR
jgi:hypothetical protein